MYIVPIAPELAAVVLLDIGDPTLASSSSSSSAAVVWSMAAAAVEVAHVPDPGSRSRWDGSSGGNKQHGVPSSRQTPRHQMGRRKYRFPCPLAPGGAAANNAAAEVHPAILAIRVVVGAAASCMAADTVSTDAAVAPDAAVPPTSSNTRCSGVRSTSTSAHEILLVPFLSLSVLPPVPASSSTSASRRRHSPRPLRAPHEHGGHKSAARRATLSRACGRTAATHHDRKSTATDQHEQKSKRPSPAI